MIYSLLAMFLFLNVTMTRSQLCNSRLNERNVALGGSVCQSSVHANGNPRRAIDGHKSGAYGENSCTHTDLDDPAWWRVDLKDHYKISKVIIVNRKDCCSERLQGAEIRIGNSTFHNRNPRCDTIRNVVSPSVTVCCNRMEGRYVSVSIVGRKEFLTLCEVEVYGIPVQEKTPCT